MMQNFMGSVVDHPPAVIKNKKEAFYSPSDTVSQYLEHFNNFRKAVLNQAARWGLHCEQF